MQLNLLDGTSFQFDTNLGAWRAGLIRQYIPKQEVDNIRLQQLGKKEKKKKPVLGFEPRSPAPHGCLPPLRGLGVLPLHHAGLLKEGS